MPSTDRSRREVLSVAGSTLAVAAGTALAGCVGTDRTAPDDDPDDATAHEASDRPSQYAALDDDEDVLSVRAADAEPFVFESETDVPDDDRVYAQPTFHVVDDAAADALFVDADEEAVDAIEHFVEGTDFETQSIFVDQRTIGDCYDRVFLGAEATADSVRTAYCRSLKPPTTPCEADHEVVEAVIVRLGRPYDDPPSSRQSSEHGSCPPSVGGDAEAGTEASDTSGNGTAASDDSDDGDDGTATSTRVEEAGR